MPTIYISTTGSYKNLGADASHALDLASLDKAIKLAGPGGTVAIIADKGAYNVSTAINIYSGGSATGSVTIKGVSSTGADMAAQFVGTRAEHVTSTTTGNEVLKLMSPAASNLVFQNMGFTNVGSAVRAGADVKNITVQHMTGNNVGIFFEDMASGANKTATVTGLVLEDITVKGYSKGVVRLQYDSHDVRMSHLVGDSQGQDDPEKIAVGIHLDGTTHNVTISDSSMSNAISAGKYFNGDGYATERGVYDVTFLRARASGNADGGFDIKSTTTTLRDTMADGNGRNYRFWGGVTMINGTALDPHTQGGVGGQEQVQITKGANVKIIGGLLSDSGSITQVLLNEGGTASVVGTQIVHASGGRLTVGPGTTTFDPALVKATAASGVYSVGGMDLAKAMFGGSHDVDPVFVNKVLAAPVAPPVAALAAPLPLAPTALSDLHLVTSNSAAQTLLGTDTQDVFVFKSGAIGKDVVGGFGKTDMLALDKALADSNKDGLIQFGGDDKIDISKTDTITIGQLKAEGVRALGKAADGLFYYADASVRPNGARESSFADDKMTGDSGDKKVNAFFFDTALGMKQGADTIGMFGDKDILVSTTKLADVGVGGHWNIAGGVFGLDDKAGHDGALGSVEITNAQGSAVQSLEFDGSTTVNGVTYYVYSTIGSAAGLPDLHI